MENGAKITTLIGHIDMINGVAVTPNVKQVISSDHKTIKVWDIKTGAESSALTVIDRNYIRIITVTPDGKQVILSSDDNIRGGKVEAWSLDREQISSLTVLERNESISVATFTPDGKQVILGLNKTIKVLSMETGEEVASFTGESDVECCAVAPDGMTIVAGERSGSLHFLRLEGTETQP
ncbi:WD40 repeat domain-containing protein [Dapis sp. BLCC M172]|uniref:WD40 repeat domain-containing protein n=1 Tax=Dapis sp. BLCC M172 TaxID=2975281 RepID=UPI003CF37895